MARLRINYERETKQLIKSVTDIQDEGCMDFKTCYSFAVSNFKYHRFLSVDSHNVNRTIKGLCEKFAVHSQLKKAHDLKELTDKFLAAPLFEQKNFGHTDSHYAIVSLLINLAQNPTIKGDFESKKIIVPEEEEGFDWTSYLMEGVDVYRGPYPDSPEWSESDGSETDEQRSEIVSEKLNSSKTSSTEYGSHSNQESILVDPQRIQSTEPKGYVWLGQNIIPPYWNGAFQKIPESQGYYNVVKDWDCYETKINPLLTCAPRTVITETQVIRETLWMLQGISELFVYERAGIVYHLRDNVRLSHLTQVALKKSLQEFMTAGTLIWELESFIESVITPDLNPDGDDPSEPGLSLTFQAFAHSVCSFLNEYKAILSSIEKDLQKQEQTHTIMQLKAQLQPWFQKLILVHSVYRNGVYKFPSLKSNNEKAALLLSCLFDTVMELDSIARKESLSVLMPIWIETSRPYIDIIDDWITNGRLVDARDEFIIQRNKTELVPDETFWKQSLIVNFSESHYSKSSLEEEEEGTKEEIKGEETVQTDAFNADTAYSILEWTPHFLQAILKPVIKAGKSMDVFSTLNCLNNVLASRNLLEREQKSLYEVFLNSLSHFQDNFGPEICDDQSQTLSSLVPVPKNPIYQMLQDRPDPLLQINMDSLFVPPVRTKMWQDHRNVRKIVDEYLNHWQCIQPLDCLLENCLYPHIINKSTWVCRELVNALITEHHLLDYLQAMRNFFLMEAGDTMFDFYTNLFSQLRFSIHPLKNLTILNQTLTQAVEKNFPEEIDKLCVYVEHVPGLLDNSSQSFQLNDTDCIKLSYTIPWPIDIVLDSKNLKKYNQIFNMLLHIKRAKYCLDQLRFDELDKPLLKDQVQEWKEEKVPRKQKIHRLHILRMRLLCFVNTLNLHIMTRILTCGDLMSDIQSAMNLDEVIACHDQYLEQILERCFLGKKNSALRDSLNQVLNITLQLNTHWNRGIDDISLETLSRMEEHFKKWIPFLQWCFDAKIAAGQYPHLEQLISSLALSNEQPNSSI